MRQHACITGSQSQTLESTFNVKCIFYWKNSHKGSNKNIDSIIKHRKHKCLIVSKYNHISEAKVCQWLKECHFPCSTKQSTLVSLSCGTAGQSGKPTLQPRGLIQIYQKQSHNGKYWCWNGESIACKPTIHAPHTICNPRTLQFDA